MLTEWRKFKGWSVLEHFLSKPESRIHIKELARKLEVSPQTSNSYLRLYEKDNILDSELIGNVVQFRLNNRNPLVRELKRMYILISLHESRFTDNFASDNPGITNIVLYGTCASGDYSHDSSIDFLVISKNSTINDSAFRETKSMLGREIHIKTYTMAEWQGLVNKDDKLIKSVQASHILLYGTGEFVLQTGKSSPQLPLDKLDSNSATMNYVCEEE